MLITVEYIQRELSRLSGARGDYEIAHGLEDALRDKVLVAIADGARNPSDLAAEVLKSSDIDFKRCCA